MRTLSGLCINMAKLRGDECCKNNYAILVPSLYRERERETDWSTNHCTAHARQVSRVTRVRSNVMSFILVQLQP